MTKVRGGSPHGAVRGSRGATGREARSPPVPMCGGMAQRTAGTIAGRRPCRRRMARVLVGPLEVLEAITGLHAKCAKGQESRGRRASPVVPFNPLPSLFRMSSLSTGEQHSRRAGVRECFPVNEVPLLINGGRAMPYGVLVVLLTCLLSATGAAVAGATAPSPPLVTPLPESPEEYLFAPPKWKPGASVRIEEHIWTEEKTRGGSTQRSRNEPVLPQRDRPRGSGVNPS